MMTRNETQKLKASMHRELNGVTHGLWQAATIVLTIIVLGVAGSMFYPAQDKHSAVAQIRQAHGASRADSERQPDAATTSRAGEILTLATNAGDAEAR
ncbi:MAG TPA: hypothetical protein VFG44_04320 [Burkholderiales bacterium]|jgi:hypothetical protein|nr:hypothetical protein [Burkholderiales bacterium]